MAIWTGFALLGSGRRSYCEVREPHDFVDQEAQVAAGIIRFIHGGSS